jgi:hypothetical protein
MAINFNTGPYFDDFDPAKNFYRVLFKPGVAVQNRELNQLQSILQHQISSMGNHLFKKNSIVIPGGISINTAADIVSVDGIEDLSVLVGRTITNAATFDPLDDSTLDGYITAVVLGYQSKTDTQPGAIYVKYFKTQTDGRSTFNPAETLKTVGGSLITFSVESTIGSTVGKTATISRGTFYTKETFVDVDQQSIIIEVDSSTITNCTIGLNIIESIVTSDDDETLLDNSNGTPNQYAPGADRYKIELQLARIDPTTTLTDDVFIKMMTIENNVTTFINNKTQYAELMSMLARRTYDANGNFIVRGLDTTVIESSSDDYVWANVSGGKCYLGGYEYEQLAATPIAIEKPRSEAFQQEVGPVVNYTTNVPYFYVAGGSYLKEIPLENSLVQFLNAAPGTSGVSVIGYGVFKTMQFAFGATGDDDVYKMYFDFITLEKGYQLSDIGGIKSITANEGAPVLHELRIGNVVGTFTAGNNVETGVSTSQTGFIYNVISNSFLYAIKDTLNAIPSTETVVDGTTGATATLINSFVTNYSNDYIPMIPVDGDVIKTLYNNDDENTTSYSVIRRDAFQITSEGTVSATLTGNDVFEEYSTSDYFAFIVTPGSEELVDLTNILSITAGGKSYELSILEGSPMIDTTVWVYSTVNRSNVVEAKKTPTTVTAGLVVPTPSASYIALQHQDVIEVTKIVDGTTVAVSNATWTSNVATITTNVNHGINVDDLVVIKGVVSSNNTSGAFASGYNGGYTVTSKTDTTFTFALTANPGIYDATPSIDAVVALPPDINSDVDITSRFNFESGNSPYLTGAGFIKLKKNATLPQGQIAIRYVYNQIGNTGSYISVDSYGDYTSEDLSYIGDIPNVLDSQNNVIETRRYIDFRTRPSNYFFKNIGVISAGSNRLALRDLNLSGRCMCLAGKYIVGPSHLNGTTITSIEFNAVTGNTELVLGSNAPSGTPIYSGTYYIGLNGSGLSLIDETTGGRGFDFPKDSTRFTYEYVKFTPRHVMIYIDRNSDEIKVDYKQVSGRQDVVELNRNEFKLPLAYMYMKPYTVAVRDITLEKFENPVYQMLDIHNLKRRIDRNEYYTSLALSRDVYEEVIDAQSEDANQASRGIWAEDFMSASGQDYFSDDFKCTIYDKSYVAPGTVTRTLNLEIDETLYTSTWAQTGSLITLPYTEERAFGNNTASRFNNLNPFNVVSWSGKLVLNPSVDNWVDTTSDPSDNVNNTATQVVADSTATTQTTNALTVPTSLVVTTPPPIVPQPPVEEIITQINNLRAAWGRDSAAGKHAITFDWVTNLGRKGRVNTDVHLSSAIKALGKNGYNGVYARSLINRRYNDPGVKEYLNAGAHFDQRPPSKW